jgi:hypothetical protein
MAQAIRQQAVIQPGGVLRIQRSDLPEGALVEVVVTIESPAGEHESPLTRFRGVARGTYGATPREADAYLDEERSSWE